VPDPGRRTPWRSRYRQQAFSPLPLMRINSAQMDAGLAVRSAIMGASSGHLERLRRWLGGRSIPYRFRNRQQSCLSFPDTRASSAHFSLGSTSPLAISPASGGHRRLRRFRRMSPPHHSYTQLGRKVLTSAAFSGPPARSRRKRFSPDLPSPPLASPNRSRNRSLGFPQMHRGNKAVD
jgi:hypothetical protein